MVDFTIRDVQVLVAMFIMLVILNSFASAAGLADAGFNESDVPKLNLTSDSFDFAGEKPQRPTADNEFIISWSEVETQYSREHQLNGTDKLRHAGSGTGSNSSIIVFQVDGTGIEDVTINDSNTVDSFVLRGWEIRLERFGEPDELLVKGEILSSPSGGGGFWESLKTGTAEAIGGIVAQVRYVGQVLFYLILTLVEGTLNVFATIFAVAVYIIDILSFLFSNFTSIVTSPTRTWAKLLLLTPIIVISVMFGKLALAIIDASNRL